MHGPKTIHFSNVRLTHTRQSDCRLSAAQRCDLEAELAPLSVSTSDVLIAGLEDGISFYAFQVRTNDWDPKRLHADCVPHVKSRRHAEKFLRDLPHDQHPDVIAARRATEKYLAGTESPDLRKQAEGARINELAFRAADACHNSGISIDAGDGKASTAFARVLVLVRHWADDHLNRPRALGDEPNLYELGKRVEKNYQSWRRLRTNEITKATTANRRAALKSRITRHIKSIHSKSTDPV